MPKNTPRNPFIVGVSFVRLHHKDSRSYTCGRVKKTNALLRVAAVVHALYLGGSGDKYDSPADEADAPGRGATGSYASVWHGYCRGSRWELIKVLSVYSTPIGSGWRERKRGRLLMTSIAQSLPNASSWSERVTSFAYISCCYSCTAIAI